MCETVGICKGCRKAMCEDWYCMRHPAPAEDYDQWPIMCEQCQDAMLIQQSIDLGETTKADWI